MASTYKLVMCGATGTGKSSFTIQFIQHHFVEDYDPTIEDSYRRQVKVGGKDALLDILDTAGDEEYAAMRDKYLRTGQGFLFLYSITDRESFERLDAWYDQIQRVKDADFFPAIAVGNKCDLEAERVISPEEGQGWANKRGIPWLEASAKTALNVEEAYLMLPPIIEWEMNHAGPSTPEIRDASKKAPQIPMPRIEIGHCFNQFFNKRDFSDIKILVGKAKAVPAHKIILYARSKLFNTLLQKDEAMDTYQLPQQFEMNVLMPVLSFMYSGYFSVTKENQDACLELSKFWKVDQFTSRCSTVISKGNFSALGDDDLKDRQSSLLADFTAVAQIGGKFSDVTLGTTKCHKLILAARSTMLRTVLKASTGATIMFPQFSDYSKSLHVLTDSFSTVNFSTKPDKPKAEKNAKKKIQPNMFLGLPHDMIKKIFCSIHEKDIARLCLTSKAVYLRLKKSFPVTVSPVSAHHQTMILEHLIYWQPLLQLSMADAPNLFAYHAFLGITEDGKFLLEHAMQGCPTTTITEWDYKNKVMFPPYLGVQPFYWASCVELAQRFHLPNLMKLLVYWARVGSPVLSQHTKTKRMPTEIQTALHEGASRGSKTETCLIS